jgi:hypothetical protein
VTRFDPVRLLKGLTGLEWSQPSTFAATGVHQGYRSVQLTDSGQPRSDLYAWVLDEFQPVWSAWLSLIEPGGYIVAHRDAGPYRERWHVPISTAGEGPDGVAVDGVPFRVDQSAPHSVVNKTDRPRIHLVIDRDVIVDPRPLRFETFKEPNG